MCEGTRLALWSANAPLLRSCVTHSTSQALPILRPAPDTPTLPLSPLTPNPRPRPYSCLGGVRLVRAHLLQPLLALCLLTPPPWLWQRGVRCAAKRHHVLLADIRGVAVHLPGGHVPARS